MQVFYEPPHKLLKDSRFWASMYVVLASVVFFVIPTEYFLFGVAGGKLIERIRSMTFKSILHQEINWFDEPKNSRYFLLSYLLVCKNVCICSHVNLCIQKLKSIIIIFFLSACSGSISARLSIDAVNVKRLVGDNLALNVQTLATVIAGFLVAMIANWKLTLIILVVIPMVGLQGYFQVKFLKGFSANAKVIS